MKESVKQVLFKHFDENDDRVLFSGWALQSQMYSKTGKNTYPSTLLNYAREYADITGSKLICVNHQKSLYEFERGFKLGNAFRDR